MNNKGKVDRRVKYTKMVIKDSFVRILKQKPISKITVKEICDEADINRATFYAHYSDPNDLLLQTGNEIIGDINKYLCDYDFNDIKLISVDVIEKILIYIEQNAELFDILLNLNGDMKFQQDVIKMIGKQFIPMIGTDSLNIKDAEYIFQFLASGAVGVIQLWLKEGMKKPAKDIAGLIMKTAINGRASFE